MFQGYATGSDLDANGFGYGPEQTWDNNGWWYKIVWGSGLRSYPLLPNIDAWQFARITSAPQMFYDRVLCAVLLWFIRI